MDNDQPTCRIHNVSLVRPGQYIESGFLTGKKRLVRVEDQGPAYCARCKEEERKKEVRR